MPPRMSWLLLAEELIKLLQPTYKGFPNSETGVGWVHPWIGWVEIFFTFGGSSWVGYVKSAVFAHK